MKTIEVGKHVIDPWEMFTLGTFATRLSHEVPTFPLKTRATNENASVQDHVHMHASYHFS